MDDQDRGQYFIKDAVRGSVKPAEPDDNPGELMAAAMPRIESIMPPTLMPPVANCPLCQARCLARPALLRGAAKLYPGRFVAVCTQCAIEGNASQGTMVLKLLELGLTPDQALWRVLDQAEGKCESR